MDAAATRPTLPPGEEPLVRRLRQAAGGQVVEVLEGRGRRPSLLPGFLLDTAQGPRLVGDVRHEGGTGAGTTAYANRFRLLPGDVPWRPPRTTPRPRIPGNLPARILSAHGDGRPDLDDLGRHQVRLPFEKPRSRHGLRVPLARPVSQDFRFPLAPGTEVLLGFLEGDPDRPVLAGVLPGSGEALADPEATGLLRGPGGGGILLGPAPGSLEWSSGTGRSGRRLQGGDAEDWAFGSSFSYVEGNRSVATVGSHQVHVAGAFMQNQAGLSFNLTAGYAADVHLSGRTHVARTEIVDYNAGSGMFLSRKTGLMALDTLTLSAGPGDGRNAVPILQGILGLIVLLQAGASFAQGAVARAWSEGRLGRLDDAPLWGVSLGTTAALMAAVHLLRRAVFHAGRNLQEGPKAAELMLHHGGLILRNRTGRLEGRIDLARGSVEAGTRVDDQYTSLLETGDDEVRMRTTASRLSLRGATLTQSWGGDVPRTTFTIGRDAPGGVVLQSSGPLALRAASISLEAGALQGTLQKGRMMGFLCLG
jgi:hypothetical protein